MFSCSFTVLINNTLYSVVKSLILGRVVRPYFTNTRIATTSQDDKLWACWGMLGYGYGHVGVCGDFLL